MWLIDDLFSFACFPATGHKDENNRKLSSRSRTWSVCEKLPSVIVFDDLNLTSKGEGKGSVYIEKGCIWVCYEIKEFSLCEREIEM